MHRRRPLTDDLHTFALPLILRFCRPCDRRRFLLTCHTVYDAWRPDRVSVWKLASLSMAAERADGPGGGGSRWSRVHTLTTLGEYTLSPSGWERLHSMFPNLQEIRNPERYTSFPLDGHSPYPSSALVASAGVQVIAECWPHLTAMPGWRFDTAEAFTGHLRLLPKLTSVEVSNNYGSNCISGMASAFLSHRAASPFPVLTKLSVIHNDYGDSGRATAERDIAAMEELLSAPGDLLGQLRTLEYKVGARGLLGKLLVRCHTTLERLVVHAWPDDDPQLRSLVLPRLRSLDIEILPMSSLPSMPALKELECDGTFLAEHSALLAQLERLRIIAVTPEGCSQLSSKEWRCIAQSCSTNLRALEYLDLDLPSGESLAAFTEALRRCTGLTELTLSGSDNDIPIRPLPPSLVKLEYPCLPLARVLPAVCGARQLRHLRVDSATDEDVAQLVELCPGLTSLWLGWSSPVQRWMAPEAFEEASPNSGRSHDLV